MYESSENVEMIKGGENDEVTLREKHKSAVITLRGVMYDILL